MPSPQVVGSPTHVPPRHASLIVQVLPSSQGVALGALGSEQTPVPVSQVPATWH